MGKLRDLLKKAESLANPDHTQHDRAENEAAIRAERERLERERKERGKQ